jgi:hypothetical protein
MHVDTPQTHCLAGAARRDITPPVGIYHRMWGASTHDRSTGVHRPLTCTALALAPDMGEERLEKTAVQVIVAVDHCLLWNAELRALYRLVSEQTGLEPSQLQVALTHTHAAGLMDPARADLPGGELIAPYLTTLATQIAAAAGEAIEKLAPSRVVYGQGRCNLAAHRDFLDTDRGLYVCGFNPAGEADDTVLVARVTRPDDSVVATIVNYACHPTTLAWDNTLISPDYVGAMREVIEAAHEGAPCVFLQGASGDLGPRRGFVGDTPVADQNGRELGYAALAALEGLPTPGTRFEYLGPVVSGATIGTWADRPLSADELCEKHRWQVRSLEVPLPYRPDLPNRELTEEELARWMREEHAASERGDLAEARDCHAQVERMARQLSRLRSLPSGDTVGVRAAVWRLGDALWVFVAGEHYQALQRSLRARFPDRPIVVSTVTGGWLPGYLPTADTYGQGIYQESIAVVAAGSLERLIESLAHELAEFG